MSHPGAMLGGVPPATWKSLSTRLQGERLLARLRGGPERSVVDPGLAGGLRDWLEDSLSESVAALPPGGEPIRVTKEAVNQVLACEAHMVAERTSRRRVTPELARGAMVDALFRQWMTTGHVGDPLAEALEALTVSGEGDGVVAYVEGLGAAARAALAEEVSAHCSVVTSSWPVPPPGWMARTQERLVVALAGGRVVLSGVVDLALGAPSAGRASVCIVELKSGRRRVEHRGDLHLYALLETLRSGAPPFRVATFYTATGELDVEPVGRDVLLGALHRVLDGTMALCRLAGGGEPERSPIGLCAWCSDLARCDVGRLHLDELAAELPATGTG